MTSTLELPFPFLSDPGGEQAIRPCEVWDAEGEIAQAAQILVTASGDQPFRYVGTDTLDRPTTEELLAAAQELNAAEREIDPAAHAHLDAGPSEKAFQLDLYTYFRGVRSGATSLYERTGAEDAGWAQRLVDDWLRFLAP
jgi:hypothetical protein